MCVCVCRVRSEKEEQSMDIQKAYEDKEIR